MATIRNNVTGVAVDGCCATTHNSASSYGLPVWADADGNAYFQVGADSPFYSVEIDTDEVRRALGAAIRERRLALGLTLDWLGKASGIAASNISKLENGAPGTIDTILKVLSALGAELKLSTTQKHRDMKTTTIEGAERAAFLATEHPELTFEKAQSLIGRRIRWTHPVYSGNHQFVCDTTIGSIRNSYEEAAKEPRKGWPSKAAWLDAEQPETAEEMRRTFLVFDDEGVCTYMFCIFPKEGERIAVGEATCQVVDTDLVFWCSDAGRAVTYEVVG